MYRPPVVAVRTELFYVAILHRQHSQFIYCTDSTASLCTAQTAQPECKHKTYFEFQSVNILRFAAGSSRRPQRNKFTVFRRSCWLHCRSELAVRGHGVSELGIELLGVIDWGGIAWLVIGVVCCREEWCCVDLVVLLS